MHKVSLGHRDFEIRSKANSNGVEGTEVCRMAGCRLGRHSNGGKAGLRDTLDRKLVNLYLCVSSLSPIDAQKTVPVPIRG